MNVTRKTVCRNIEQLGTKNYRCRVYTNGKRFEHYETNLTRAKTWVKNVKNGMLKLK